MEKKLTLEHLASYLPYGLKCQYKGIINGKEMARQRKEFEKENTPFINWEHYKPIEEKTGCILATSIVFSFIVSLSKQSDKLDRLDEETEKYYKARKRIEQKINQL